MVLVLVECLMYVFIFFQIRFFFVRNFVHNGFFLKYFSKIHSGKGKADRRGAVGLANIGNTCYMNSVLQCLSHAPLLRNFLISDQCTFDMNF
eukprot:GSMAST32.ASY1.ANO1.197.1 assembled CDS